MPDPEVPIEDSLSALVDLKNEGKIRHIGVSNFSLDQLTAAMALTDITSVQNPLSAVTYNDDRGEMLKFCENNSITWIAYAPVLGHRNAHRVVEYADWIASHVAHEHATCSPYSLLLAWMLAVSPVTIPIPATTRLEHLVANMEASSIQLSPEETQLLMHPRSWRELYYETKQSGDFQAALKHLHTGLGFISPQEQPFLLYDMACTYALAGEEENALSTLERATESGFNDAAHVSADADLQSLHSLPRFRSILEKMAAPIPDAG